MKDQNFLTERNARAIWHPRAHPADTQKNPHEIIVAGDGVSITDIDGHTTVDGVGGLWNVNLGFSCQPIKDAIAAQLERLPYYSIFRGTTNDLVIELGDMLAEFFAEDGLERAFYTSGGSDSVEIALRLARQYHKIRGEAGRGEIPLAQEGLSRHAYTGREREWQCQFPHPIRAADAGLLSYPRTVPLSQPVQRK
jgi:adenosylmethionine-8-amino-7-oxononanoate aminotransferase